MNDGTFNQYSTEDMPYAPLHKTLMESLLELDDDGIGRVIRALCVYTTTGKVLGDLSQNEKINFLALRGQYDLHFTQRKKKFEQNKRYRDSHSKKQDTSSNLKKLEVQDENTSSNLKMHNKYVSNYLSNVSNYLSNVSNKADSPDGEGNEVDEDGAAGGHEHGKAFVRKGGTYVLE